MNLGIVINYCTNDYRFLDLCLKHVTPITPHIVVAVADHFFDGTPENASLLQHSYLAHPQTHFVEYAYTPTHPYGWYCPLTPDDEDWAHYWHSTSRYVGFCALNQQCDYVLFLDVDEIVDTSRFLAWLRTRTYETYTALRLSSNFYFRTPTYRAISPTLNALLIKKQALDAAEVLLTVLERKGVFDALCGTKLNGVVGADHLPLIDHYSWVRTKEELLRKVTTWGHRTEKNWTQLVEEELSHPFTGTEHLFSLKYQNITAKCDPLNVSIPTHPLVKTRLPNVTYLDSQILKKQLSLQS